MSCLYNFEVDRIINEVSSRNAKRILLQFPDGMKNYALSIAREIKSKLKFVDVFISADPCYGGCDLAIDEALRFNVDLIIHFGHSPYPIRELNRIRIPVIYVPAFSNLSIRRAVENAIRIFNEKKFGVIGLLSTIQHVHKIDEAKEILENNGFRVIVGRKCGKVSFDGQILGCDVCSALSIIDDVDAFLVLAGGDFHALGVALSTNKPVFVADPFKGECRDISNLVKKTLSLRWYSIVRASEANIFGIVVGAKPGQAKVDVALKAKEYILSKGRECYLIIAREITPEVLLPFHDIDAFVIIACPRIVIDDSIRFRKPILTFGELKIALEGVGDNSNLSSYLRVDLIGN